MRHHFTRLSVAVLVAALLFPCWADEPAGDDQIRKAAEFFGQALQQGDTSKLSSVLPEKGKVQIRLHLLGPGEGFFSPSQVEALLRDFLGQGSVSSFKLLQVEHDAESYALAHCRAKLTDREGRPASVDLHLAFQPENGRWVLREIRETRS